MLEITAAVALLFACVWLAPRLSEDRRIAHRIGAGFGLAAGTVGLASALRRGEKLRELGLGFTKFLRAAAAVAGPTLLVVTALLVAGYCLDSWHFTEQSFRIRPPRWLWPVVQQYFVQSFLNRRWQDVVGRGWRSVLLTALCFSLLHLPNPTLMVATFLAGTFWAWSFQREPNLYALALSHVTLAFFLKSTLPLAILPNMRIGWAYFR